ncbi:DEAD/DEAH box helicase [Lysinibacillus fusiformis]|nr:DEAD/DEAH box helicase [Lysinibacillus fusiformis]
MEEKIDTSLKKLENIINNKVNMTSSDFDNIINDIYFNILKSKIRKTKVVSKIKISKYIKLAVQLEILGFSKGLFSEKETKKALEIAGLIYEYLSVFERNNNLDKYIHDTRYNLRAAICYNQSDGEAKSLVVINKLNENLIGYIQSNDKNKTIDTYIILLLGLVLERKFKEVINLIHESKIENIYNRLNEYNLSVKYALLPSDSEQNFYKFFRKSIINLSNYMLNGKRKYLISARKEILFCSNFFKDIRPSMKWLINRYETVLENMLSNSIWSNLPFDREYKKVLVNSGIFEVWKTQKEIIKKDFLSKNRKTAAISIPTSAGKTLIAEWFIYNQLKSEGATAIYVVPTNALANQIELNLSQHLHPLGISVATAIGGMDFDEYEFKFYKEIDILIVTPEKLQMLLRNNLGFIENVKVVVIDEFHKIGIGERGQILEQALIGLNLINPKNISYCFISGMMSNSKSISKWLTNDSGSFNHIDDWRPTRQRFTSCKFNVSKAEKIPLKPRQRNERYTIPGELHYVDRNIFTNQKFNRVIPSITSATISFGKSAKIETRLYSYVSDIVQKITNYNETTLVYFETPASVKGFCKNLNYTPYNKSDNLTKLRAKIIEHFGNNHPMLKYLDKKVIYHYGNLPKDIRYEIELAVKEKKIEVVVATSTLLEGIDLPISNLVIASPYNYNSTTGKNELIQFADFYNLVGRVGRALKETDGLAILVEPVCNRQALEERGQIRQYEFLDEFLNVNKEKEFTVDSTLNKFDIREGDGLKKSKSNEHLTSFIMLLREHALLEKIEDVNRILEESLFGVTGKEEEIETLANEWQFIFTNYIEPIPSKKLSLYVKMGFGLEGCHFIESKVKEKIEGNKEFFKEINKKDFWSFLVTLIRDIPNFERKLSLNILVGNKVDLYSDIISTWVEGNSEREIYEKICEKYEYSDDIDTITEFIYKDLMFIGPWITFAVNSVLNQILEEDDEIVIDKFIYFLPTAIKLGVPNYFMMLSLYMGIEKKIARIITSDIIEKFEGTQTELKHFPFFIKYIKNLEVNNLRNLNLSPKEVDSLFKKTEKLFVADKLEIFSQSIEVVGLKYYEANKFFEIMKEGEKIVLKAEPTNKFDINAIGVYYEDNKLGYLPRRIAFKVSSLLKRGKVFNTIISKVNQYQKLIELNISEKNNVKIN